MWARGPASPCACTALPSPPHANAATNSDTGTRVVKRWPCIIARLLSKVPGSCTSRPATCQGSQNPWVRRRLVAADRVRLDLHEHLGCDQRAHAHESRGRADVPEELAVGAA